MSNNPEYMTRQPCCMSKETQYVCFNYTILLYTMDYDYGRQAFIFSSHTINRCQ